MRHEGFINGYPVSFEVNSSLWEKSYPLEVRYQVEKCRMLLPPDISKEDFLKGMMKLTRGVVNPVIILEVWDENSKTTRK